ncbi:MAG: hypothetical protein ACTSU9_18475 [Promethearchaeota archaeon]
MRVIVLLDSPIHVTLIGYVLMKLLFFPVLHAHVLLLVATSMLLIALALGGVRNVFLLREEKHFKFQIITSLLVLVVDGFMVFLVLYCMPSVLNVGFFLVSIMSFTKFTKLVRLSLLGRESRKSRRSVALQHSKVGGQRVRGHSGRPRGKRMDITRKIVALSLIILPVIFISSSASERLSPAIKVNLQDQVSSPGYSNSTTLSFYAALDSRD